MPHKHTFRFYLTFDLAAVPEDIKNAYVPDVTDYFLGWTVYDADMLGNRWERVPWDGIMDFPLTTTKKSGFLIGVTIVPNSKVDPDAPESRPLQRSAGIDTDDFAPLKATDAPELAKKFPDGVFILQIDLVAFYVPIVVKESTTFDAVLAQTNIRPEDIVYNDSSAITDASGKVITQHDVVYWLTDLHLSGQKYVP